MSKAAITATVILLNLAAAAGCDSSDEIPPAQRIQMLDRDLAPGSSGDEVRAVHDYLRWAGYLPNDELMRRYPAWRPIVSTAPEDDAVFDQHTADAVFELQTRASLPATGIVDEATRALVKRPRCGVPDGITSPDPSDKFAIFGKWTNTTQLNWAIRNSDDVPYADARAAMGRALASWSAQTNMNFVEYVLGTSKIEVYAPPSLEFQQRCGPYAAACVQSGPPTSGNIYLNRAVTWSAATPTPAGATDFERVMLHELGHSLGLDHSDATGSAMLPGTNGTRALGADDKMAISINYDVLATRAGTATDIGVRGIGNIWYVTGTPTNGGFTVCAWAGSGSVCPLGGAVRIAVAGNGVPWIVNSFGEIWRRTSTSAHVGTWELMPESARDIAAGSDGSVWIVSTVAQNGGFRTSKWNGSGWDPDTSTALGAIRIAVDSSGTPWVTNSTGAVFRRTDTSPATGFWLSMNAPVAATDIGAGPRLSGSGGAAWIVAGSNVYAWNGQAQTNYPPPQGGVSAPARNAWIRVFSINGGSNAAISVDMDGTPYIVQNNGTMVWPTR